jgi:hypothetical protein
MKKGILFCVLWLSGAQAEWTAKPPVKATVWSFDKKCVQLKLADGSMRSVERSLLKINKLESRITTVQIHPDSLPADSCSK